MPFHRGWQKRHAFVVEQCRAINVRDVFSPIDTQERASVLSSPRVADLELVSTDAGCVRRWWFRCPTCSRRRESLFVPPIAVDDWRCRICWDLIYASQRYGRRHPIRRVLTYRKQLTRQRQKERERRHYRRAEARATRLAMTARRRRAREEAKQRRAAEKAIKAARKREARWCKIMRRELEFDALLNQEYLDAIARGELSPRSKQARAAQLLNYAR